MRLGICQMKVIFDTGQNTLMIRIKDKQTKKLFKDVLPLKYWGNIIVYNKLLDTTMLSCS